MNAVRCALKVGSFYAGLYAVLMIIYIFIINRRIAFVTKKVERLAISKCITPVRGSYNGIIHCHDFLPGWLIHVCFEWCVYVCICVYTIYYYYCSSSMCKYIYIYILYTFSSTHLLLILIITIEKYTLTISVSWSNKALIVKM